MTKNKINITFSDKNRQMNNRGWIYIYIYITEINCSSTSSHTYIYIAVALILPENQKNVRLPTFLKCQLFRP